MGLVFPGERVVFRGHDLFNDLKDIRWMELLLLGITGRKFTSEQMRLFEGIWVLSTSYPDPRIWNNRISALGGTSRSTAVLSISGAMSASEATIYGFKPIIGAYDFISRARSLMTINNSLEEFVIAEIKKYRTLPGYARPIINSDERIIPLYTLAKKLCLADGEHTRVAFMIEDILQTNRYRLKMNVAALAAALCADQELSLNEYYLYLTPCFIGGMLPCFMDTSHQPAGTFLPVTCERISYKGKPSRKW